MSVKKNILANYSGNLLMLLINLLLVPLYLSHLSVEEYGLITFFSTIFTAFVILDMGLGLTINKEVANSVAKVDSLNVTGDIIRSFELVYWAMAILIGLVLSVFAEWISVSWLNVEHINSSELILIVSLMGCALLFRWPISFYENVLSGFQKMVRLNFIKIIIGIVNFGSLYFLFNFFNLKIKGYFLFLTFLYLINIIILTTSVWRVKELKFFKAKFDLRILKQSKKYILGIGVYSIIGTIYVVIDKIIISKFFLASELAYYSLISMASLSLFQFVYPISAALFPKFVENNAKGKNGESLDIFRKGYQLVIVLVFSFSSLLFVFKKSIFLLWTQNELVAANSIVFLVPILLGTVFYSLHVLVISIYTSLGKTKEINRLYVFCLALYLCLLLFSAQEKSMLWIAYSWCLSNAVLLILSYYLAIKILTFNVFLSFFKNDLILPFLILTVIVVLSSIIEIPKMTFGHSLIAIIISLVLFLLVFSCCSSYLRSMVILQIKGTLYGENRIKK